MTTFGESLREIRINSDDPPSLREVARRAEIAASYLSDIELGNRWPSDDVCDRLADALGMSRRTLRRIRNQCREADA